MFRLTRPASPPLDNDPHSSNPNSRMGAAACRQQALTRSGRKLARHHPNVKLPPRFEDQPKEIQILRCCDRFKNRPDTVDTMIRALSTIRTHPREEKYRRINQSNPGYQRSLANAPGAEQLLFTLGFVPVDYRTLVLATVNPHLLEAALTILKQTKETPEYQQAKQEQVFAAEMTAQLSETPTEAEQGKRRELLSQLPREPSQGRSAVMMVQLGDKNSTTLTRRFDGDDTLLDVLHWLGGIAGTVFLEKLIANRQWSMVDVNRHGHVPLDCEANQHKTLQHLGFWPSGRLSLRPSSAQWMQGSSSRTELGASRGLGSAPSETLQL